MNSSPRAILLVNLGSPDEPSAPAIARYLAEFLSDRRVVNIPKLLWWPILHGIILRTRPAKLVKKYAAIWQDEGAPLKAITAAQAYALNKNLKKENFTVYWAMRYQNPSIHTVLKQIIADGFNHVLVIPMYPQYSMTTTATVDDAIKAAITETSREKHVITYTLINGYHDHPAYINALKISILQHWQKHGRPDFSAKDRLLLSFHGLPERNVQCGDPYQAQSQRTTALLTKALGLTEKEVNLSFQSRFGSQKWLQPYTRDTLEAFARTGTQRVDVICPGFATDCLETLEEVNIELRKNFLELGGKSYHYIPCLNADEMHIELLRELALTHE